MNNLYKRLKVFSQISLQETILLLSRRLMNHTSFDGRPYDEFVFADTLKYILDNDGDSHKKGQLNLISFHYKPLARSFEFALRRQTTDFHVFNQIFRSGEYALLKDLSDRYLDNSRCLNIVDAGANVGCSSVWLSCLYPNSRVFAFEIDKSNFELMTKNIQLNRLEDSIEPLHYAFWYEDTELLISDQFRDGREYAFSVQPINSQQKPENFSIKVNAMSLQSLKSRFDVDKIDILKMDIEGSESHLLQDLDRAAETLQDVNILAVEIHDEVSSRSSIEANLEKLGFQWFSEGETLFAYRS